VCASFSSLFFVLIFSKLVLSFFQLFCLVTLVPQAVAGTSLQGAG
jgi:hypothetical protein